MRDRGTLLVGIGMGVGLMYLLDPSRGRRRRALIRDQVVHAANVGARGVGAARRDLAHRARGIAAQLQGALRRGRADDSVMVGRVRSLLGRTVSHPHAIRVESSDGCVTLSGPILQDEVAPLMQAVARIRGVCGVVNALAAHTDANHVSALQGDSARRSPSRLWRRRWAPGQRALVGTAATALAATGLGLVARAARGHNTSAWRLITRTPRESHGN